MLFLLVIWRYKVLKISYANLSTHVGAIHRLTSSFAVPGNLFIEQCVQVGNKNDYPCTSGGELATETRLTPSVHIL